MAVVWTPVDVDGSRWGGGGFRGLVNGVRVFTLVRRDVGIGWALRHTLPWPEVPYMEFSVLRDAQDFADRIVAAYEALVGRPIGDRDQPVDVRGLPDRDPL